MWQTKMLQSIISQVENGHAVYTKEEVLNLLKNIQDSLPAAKPAISIDYVYTTVQDHIEEKIEEVKEALYTMDYNSFMEISIGHKNTIEVEIDGDGVFQELGLNVKHIMESIKEDVEEDNTDSSMEENRK